MEPNSNDQINTPPAQPPNTPPTDPAPPNSVPAPPPPPAPSPAPQETGPTAGDHTNISPPPPVRRVVDPSKPAVMPSDDKDSDSDGGVGTLLSGFFGGLFGWVIAPFALVLILHFFVFQAYHVVGSSMVNTLHDADYLIISKVNHTLSSVGHKPYIPKREQIIVFHYPKDPSLVFVKRVIGLPGERVAIKDGQVRVYNSQNPNGFDPNTGYEPAGTSTLIDTDVIVPPDNVFVLGDNRTPNGSSDSRDWGFLPANDIIGNAVARLLPLDQARIF
jgi:signal peptidase I